MAADDKDDVHGERAFGSEDYMLRQIPLAAILFALGSVALLWPLEFSWPKYLTGAALALGSVGYIVFASIRAFVPGPPRLVLSKDGIRQRLSHGRILHIPWDEVQGVIYFDHRLMNVRGFWQTVRDVPAVLVSPAFYERVMPHQPFMRRPLNWGHFAEPRDGAMLVLFRHDYLGTQRRDLREAIETRWRAFSRHPNAGRPQHEARPVRLVPDWLLPWIAPAVLLIAVLPPAYFIWKPPELSDALRAYYLGDLLDQGGVTARMPDGRITRLLRMDVAGAETPRCDLVTVREAWRFWMPWIAGATCTAGLSLRSGGRAMAAFRLVTETDTVEYELGKFTEQSWIVAKPMGVEEAEVHLCGLGHCGPGTQGNGSGTQ
jgi:hypothetical protein